MGFLLMPFSLERVAKRTGHPMKKRILHYLILAAVLLALPALFACLGADERIWDGVKSFPPRTEKVLHGWKEECPFSWPWFLGFATWTVLCMFPLVRRAIRAAFAHAHTRTCAHAHDSFRFPWWGWLGVGIIAVFWPLAWSRLECIRPILPHISYAPLWTGYILVMNGLCVKRSGTSPMTRHPMAYLLTLPVSSLFWWFFEYLNRYVWNWYYRGVSHMGGAEYAFFATICFASVLPAVTSTAAWLHTFPAFRDDAYDGLAKVDLRRPGWCVFLAAVAGLGLSGIVFFPQYSYPLLWISPLSVFVLVQILLREPCVLDRLKTGNWSLWFRFSVAALICGLCWETWNWHAVAKWVYSVPFVHRFQVWEMPLIGFAGYLPFGVECAAVTAWVLPALVEDGDEPLS